MPDPDRVRGKRKITRPTRPYLSAWILTQPSPRKEVLLQVFSGTPEWECAHKLDMPVDEVESIARSAAKECPAVMEDEYTMAYYSAKSAEEFRRVTGQGAGIYKFLSLRYKKSEPRVTRPATQSAATPTATTQESKAASPKRDTARKSTGTEQKAKRRPAAKRSGSSSQQAKSTPAESTPQETTPPPSPQAHANDPEAQRRREARRAARELERARRLSGDW